MQNQGKSQYKPPEPDSDPRLLAEIQSVLAITRALVSELDLNNVLEFITAQAQHLMNADGVAVWLLNETDEQLRVLTPVSSRLPIQAGASLPTLNTLAGLALSSQRVQISNEAENDALAASFRNLLPSPGLGSVLFAPLSVKGEDLGVLSIWSQHSHAFTGQDERLMRLFADAAALALHNARLHAQNRQLAIEQERHRLARDLHDSVTQSLHSIGLLANALIKLPEEDMSKQARDSLAYIYDLSKAALVEMRQHLYQLQPAEPSENLVEALSQYCQTLKKQYALDIDLEISLTSPLSENQSSTLYYIAREALWNIIKHAKANHIVVKLSQDGDQIMMIVQDNGVGFDLTSSSRTEEMGLRNMEERAGLIGGTFKLKSEPGQGTELVVWLPHSYNEVGEGSLDNLLSQ
jgi:signal transduction histidine kinase